VATFQGRRTVLPISLSPANPDAVTVATALRDVAQGGRSAALLAWAAAFLRGEVGGQPALIPELGISEEELDQLLDDF
jgi:hypothetical protein